MFQSFDSRKYNYLVLSLKILVLDNNLRCLVTISKMLETLGYEVMTANSDTPVQLFGSKMYFQKPLKILDLNNLWKYALWKIDNKRVITVDVENFERLQSHENIVNNNRKCQFYINTKGQTHQSVIIKEHKYEIAEKWIIDVGWKKA